MNRRDFLKAMTGGAAAAALAPAGICALEGEKRQDSHVGILYDATLCVGCQVCMKACKEANSMPSVRRGPLKIWENPMELSAETLCIIKKYENGTREKKDCAENGYAFIKRQCLHCVEPACVSACPASAMAKDPLTGIVSYDKKACIGCRYCQVACQFNIPRFQWDKKFPEIVKCQMCPDRVLKGGIPACSAECPTGATVFGHVSDLLKEADRRLAMTPGGYGKFPVSSLASDKTATRRVPVYVDHVYGRNEIGGTQVLFMSGVPYDLLRLPDLPEKSYVSISENIQHTVYKGMAAPALLLGGLVYAVRKNKNHED
jgi:Fe-S-cluster-containing dehydrogenase component